MISKLWKLISNKFVITIIILFFVCLVVSKNFVQIAFVNGESMLPTYKPWQPVLVKKHHYKVNVGDVILFKCDRLDSVLIKRVVAVSGDEVWIKDGELYVNGSRCTFSEKYTNIEYAGIAEQLIVLGDDEYFCLGDNIQDSKDSRYEEVGKVYKEQIIGKIMVFSE